MQILKVLIIFSIVLIGISCGQKEKTISQDIYNQLTQNDDLDCDQKTLQVVSIIAELGKFRSSNEKPFSQSDDEKIRQLVEQLKHKNDLIALAKLTRILVITPTSGECLKTELAETYSRAFWDSIEILAQDRSEKNLQEMKFLKKEFNIDGGDSYSWSTIVDRIPAP